ncbi:MAG: hypothetical protein IJQ82_02890 [Selenomonadaceae bacterium]|nr:hypothetical protein [Selenomonadaceae bacterium]
MPLIVRVVPLILILSPVETPVNMTEPPPEIVSVSFEPAKDDFVKVPPAEPLDLRIFT